ncbi:MAG: single-stranded-DNA-specific exonuclease RecJ [OM182 bacterium]|jgi:single-stranded-DNA-specific exonuclease|uniref:Single-stranded-DNA-specific exonuclease RecJ n=4 Tax=OM182 clade TaxID=745002 RepID=A0A0R2T312_9GAMM|nr:MAG: single-stranded-DNA-specific exonuclease RecJ [OM182 bacterium BACL3 MAG-120619-bin3]KRP29371.1 MAG: single-stranded-DNA-specific exonuclease RecJ [OM182 bacterium BACL3 MAG-120924-bin41]KRP35507.1 MAG: single-stranded-DNA-specific exonuclease RecJ [OM182 bacterium BACL3 MAG-121001-bin29]KRP38656.1 MAG: single-stranded-DNA-specific exonuclease RecJ [OM182 bacterium BACL3 MAG-120531-bin86]MDP4661835.1 single-stranded-DNA-specific exonuclease RecJ [OM182 bacterium]MDP4784008.1 single-str
MPIQLITRTPGDLVLPESLPPLVRRIYSQRPLAALTELELTLSQLIPPARLKGIDAAVGLLEAALKEGERLLIVADFDADGATSCALALTVLRAFGCAHVDYIVPNRFEYGYGLTPEIVELAKGKNPDLIITVDNGISSIEGIESARAAGIKTLVTDHHLPGRELPAADAIVNPNQPGCEFPSKSIAGVGVIFYVMLALRSRLRDNGWFTSKGIPEPNLAEQLDLVALGTVADVVALDHNNRILVSEGIKRIRAGRARPGILSLLTLAKRNFSTLAASDLGFAVGPRLNAAGRLDDMSTGIECLLTQSEHEAHEYALELDGMNKDRRDIEAGMREQAFALVDQLAFDADDLPAGLSLFDERWHQGVVGIVASRIKERCHRPVIAFALADADDPESELKGSARSIPGFHIRDALDAVAAANPGLVTKFGGHAMAAGLSLSRANFDAFAQAFAAEATRVLSPELLQATIVSDGELSAEELTLGCAADLAAAGPWGQAFPEPTFHGRFKLQQQRRLGENHLKMVLSPLGDDGFLVDAIAFGVSEADWPASSATEIELAYRLNINEFRGARTLQLMVEHLLGSH